MSEKSHIAWTDSTVNFWEGCTKVSPGCLNCYAEARDRRHMIEPVDHWGPGAPRRKSKSAIKDALRMNKLPWICAACGEAFNGRQLKCRGLKCPTCGGEIHRRRIFSLSLGDWLDEEVPIEWLAEMLDTIRQCDQVTWILCSKRWENFFDRLKKASPKMPMSGPKIVFANWINSWVAGEAPANIIGLCSVEDKEMTDKRILQFLGVPMACHGLSMEPLLGPVEFNEDDDGYLRGWHIQPTMPDGEPQQVRNLSKVDWIIVGCESGLKRRFQDGYEVAARSLILQGQSAGVAVFHKQMPRYDKVSTNPAEWPSEFQAREWPKGF